MPPGDGRCTLTENPRAEIAAERLFRYAAALRSDVDPEANLEISKQLDSGESLIWAGLPRQGIFLRGADVFMIPFSLMWGGFAIFWEASVVAADGPIFFMLWGVPFVLVGLYLIIGRFFVDAKLRSMTFYGVTDRRVLILSGIFSRSTNSLPLESLHDLSVTEKSDGSGTISFGRAHPFASMYAGMQWPGMGQYQVPTFELIPSARSIHDRILEAKRAAA